MPHCAALYTASFKIQDANSQKVDSLSPETIIHIPVVVHVIWHEEAENLHDSIILSGIAALNRDYLQANQDQQYVPAEFANVTGYAGIQFCLAATDPNGAATTAITRTYTEFPAFGTTNHWYNSQEGGVSAWDPDQYLNIWVLNIGSFITGFASYPGQTALPYTGVVIHSRYFGIRSGSHYGLGRVATHEVGHFFGLQHPWADDSNCSTDDGITDTPLQYEAHGGCPSYPQSGCSASEMFMNFMDYVDDPCMLMFTNEQCQKMRRTAQIERAALINSPIRCQSPVEELAGGVSVFPNPAQSQITASFQFPPMKLVNVVIFNHLGQRVLVDERLVNDQLEIDVTALPAGMYYLKVGKSVARFLKVN